jgi:outer membrane protein assembly factor BamB
MALQWFGEPGPSEIIDRHHRPMSSLVRDGRVFVPANDKVYAVDAYNGASLWSLAVPNSRRIGALKNCGQMLLEQDALFIATECDCWRVDVVTGACEAVLNAPQLDPAVERDWGYLNVCGGRLLGSGQKRGASFSALDWDTCGVLEGDFRLVMVSDYLFAMDPGSGETLWTYGKGRIMNNAITVLDGRVWCVESRNAKSLENIDGRMRIDHFCESPVFLLALDAATGEVVLEQPVDWPFQHIMYLNGARQVVLASGTYNENDKVFYELRAFNARDGKSLWNTRYEALDIRGTGPSPLEGSHGEQWQHPVINGDTIYSRPYAFDLETGDKRDYIAYRGGHGCGGWTASKHYLYGRGDYPRMYPLDVKSTDGIRLTQSTRPGCWLNIIPACGLVLVPESSSGCTCAYAIQTSLAFVPRAQSGLDREDKPKASR